MRFFRREDPTRSILSAILSSDHVVLCISLTDASGKPRIIFETGKPIDMDNDAVPLLKRLTDALTQAEHELITEGLPHIVSRKVARKHFDLIEIFYGAPWYVSTGRRITIERAKTAPLTAQDLETFMSENVEGLLPPEMHNALILEEHSHGFTVNGYPVENPVGTEGREISMHLFISATDVAVKEAVEAVLHRSLHARETNHHSVLLPLVRSLGRTKVRKDSYLLTEVSGYVTEISKIDRNLVLDTASFPVGFETVMKNAATTLQRRPEEAKAWTKQPGNFALTEAFTVAQGDALARWSKGYAEALQTLQAGSMPEETVLIADTSFQDSFKREIEHISGMPVCALSKEAYMSLYDPSARPNAHLLSALLAI